MKVCKLKIIFLSFGSALLLSCKLWASDKAPDVSAGKYLHDSFCASCHGEEANGKAQLNAPNLAGQHQDYLFAQLNSFASGARGSNASDISGQQMAAISESFSNNPTERLRAFKNVSAYLGSLEKPTMLLNDQKTGFGNDAGYKIYQASCGACHGADASGNSRLNSPSLAGLNYDYLSRQYQNFLDGSRGSGGGDKLGRQMSMVANTMTDKDKIDAVLKFIVSLNDERPNDSN